MLGCDIYSHLQFGGTDFMICTQLSMSIESHSNFGMLASSVGSICAGLDDSNLSMAGFCIFISREVRLRYAETAGPHKRLTFGASFSSDGSEPPIRESW